MKRAATFAVLLAACSTGAGNQSDDDDDQPNPDGTVCCDAPTDGNTGGDSSNPNPDGPGVDSPPGVCTDGLGPWTGQDNVAPSENPPCGLSPSQVPQFVALGWDDNAYSGLDGSGGTGGMTWVTTMSRNRTNPDGTPVRFSFYFTSTYAEMWSSESQTFVKRAWHTAMVDGHEVGNHTVGHLHGAQFDQATWNAQITGCNATLIKPFDPNEVNFEPNNARGIGADPAQIVGFRTPFLEYNDATLAAVKANGFRYDTSIEDGYQYDMDGSNYLWPYTLDNGSPGHEILVKWGSRTPITPHPGLWELPDHPVIVPPDAACAQYGVPSGLRARLQQRQSWFDTESGKITGFDYNLWVSFSMTKAEFLATLKYTLDQRLAGNRAPFMFGTHSDYYSSKYTAVPNATLLERQQAIEEFLDYARSKPEVRVVPNAKILEWVRNPVPL